MRRAIPFILCFILCTLQVQAQSTTTRQDTISVGYTSGNQKTMSGAVEKVTEDRMNKGLVTSSLDALSGQAAGVSVSSGADRMAMLSSVRVRGTTSLTGGNEPLVIIDGVYSDLATLTGIYPADIESFTILKDASETAQYGSRGAAGVIDIKTMRGKSGRLRISYNGSVDIAVPYKRLNMLSPDDYRLYARQHGLALVDLGAGSDFQKQIERTAFTHQQHLAFAGGSEKSSYRVSMGYINEQEVIKGYGNRSFMANMNMTQMMWDDFLRIDIGMFGSTVEEKTIDDLQKLFYSAAAFNPTFPDHPNSSGEWDSYPSASQINNPHTLLDKKNHNTGTHISSYTKFTFQLLPGLKFTTFGAYTYDSNELMGYKPTMLGGEASRQNTRSEALLLNGILSFDKKWNIHALQASLFAEIQDNKRRGFGVTVEHFSNDLTGYDNLSGGASRPWDGTTSFYEHPSMASFMGQAAYTLNDRYSVSATLRADGSSKFGDNHKWGYFPSVSVGWDLGKEPFVKNLNFFNELKLNAGLGWAGNQGAIDSYTTLRLLEPNGTPSVGQTLVTTFSELKNSNPDLKWEVSRTFNIGLNTQMLDRRLVFSASYYYTKVYDMLYPYTVSVPPFKYPKLVANMGSMEKSGLEISVGGTPFVARDMELTVNANLTFQDNKLLSLSGDYNGEMLLAPSMAAASYSSGLMPVRAAR